MKYPVGSALASASRALASISAMYCWCSTMSSRVPSRPRCPPMKCFDVVREVDVDVVRRVVGSLPGQLGALIRDLQGVAVGEGSPPAPGGPGRGRAAAAAGSPRARPGVLPLVTLQHFRGNLDDSVQAAGGAGKGQLRFGLHTGRCEHTHRSLTSPFDCRVDQRRFPDPRSPRSTSAPPWPTLSRSTARTTSPPPPIDH